jgi:hypothetical protein
VDLVALPCSEKSALHDLKVPTLLSCGIGDVWVLSIMELQVSLRIGAIGHVLAVVMMFLAISPMVWYKKFVASARTSPLLRSLNR